MSARRRVAGGLALVAAAACAAAPEVVSSPGAPASVETDPAVNERIGRIGRAILDANDAGGGSGFVFEVFHDTDANALALPRGAVYVSTGLIALCEDEAEMAGLLAHEIAHVTEGHSAKRAAAALPGLAYTRAMEDEADDTALRLLEETRYDLAGLARIFERIAALDRSGSAVVRRLASDHPDFEARAAVARRRIDALPPWMKMGDANREEWLAFKEALLAPKPGIEKQP